MQICALDFKLKTQADMAHFAGSSTEVLEFFFK